MTDPTPPPPLPQRSAADAARRAGTGEAATAQPHEAPTAAQPHEAPTTAQPHEAPTSARPGEAPTAAQPREAPATAEAAPPTTAQPREAPATPEVAPGIAGVDDTGVAALSGNYAEIGRGFATGLLNLSFTRFITRRLASVFYLVGLVAIGIAFLATFVGGIISGIGSLGWNLGGGIALIASTVIITPVLAFLAVVALRFVIEAVVALVAIAENTERTAHNTHG